MAEIEQRPALDQLAGDIKRYRFLHALATHGAQQTFGLVLMAFGAIGVIRVLAHGFLRMTLAEFGMLAGCALYLFAAVSINNELKRLEPSVEMYRKLSQK